MHIGYKKEYRLKVLVPGKKSINVTFPYEVVQREAERQDISVEQFLKDFVVIAEYDNFNGVRYSFKLKGIDGEKNGG